MCRQVRYSREIYPVGCRLKMLRLLLGVACCYHLAAAQTVSPQSMNNGLTVNVVTQPPVVGQPAQPASVVQQQRQGCNSYMIMTGCAWTRHHSCPGQTPTGINGIAVNDGSQGFACCCTYQFWKRAGPGSPSATVTSTSTATTPAAVPGATTPASLSTPAFKPLPTAPTTAPPVTRPGQLPPGTGTEFVGFKGMVYENIPRYIKLKYKLIQWFENQKVCPYNPVSKGFPAWMMWKAVMAAGPAVTTPAKGVAGNRTLEVRGMCPSVPSSRFSCVRESSEIKARSIKSGVHFRLDQIKCELQDITLYKMANKRVGVRYDFAQCTGHSHIGAKRPHVPKTASINMELSREILSPPDAPSANFSDFFLAVCDGKPAASFRSMYLPKYQKHTAARKSSFMTCFAESANTAHVIGKGCFDDFLFFNLEDMHGVTAKIPARDYDKLVALIPASQTLEHPVAFQPKIVPAPVSPVSPCTTAAPPALVHARKLQSPCATAAPSKPASPCKPESPCAVTTTEASPCTTAAPPTPAPTPPPTPPPLTCENVRCPVGTHQIANAHLVSCADPAKCGDVDVYKCCIHHSPDVPGVVVQDRVCIFFQQCACDNNCNCATVQQLIPQTSTTTATFRGEYVCRDYPKENFLIAVIALIISWYFCKNAWEGPRFRWCCWTRWPGGIANEHLTTVKNEIPGGRNLPGGQTSMARSLATSQPANMKGSMLNPKGEAKDRTITTEYVTSAQTIPALGGMNAIVFHTFYIYAMITFTVVHLTYLVWWLLCKLLQAKFNDGETGFLPFFKGWNNIDLWVCPFTLFPIWIALWMTLWWAMCMLRAWEITVTSETRSTAALAFIDSGSMAMAGAEGGAGGGTLARLSAMVTGGGGQRGGGGYASFA